MCLMKLLHNKIKHYHITLFKRPGRNMAPHDTLLLFKSSHQHLDLCLTPVFVFILSDLVS